MELTIYIENVQGQEARNLANEIEAIMGVHVIEIWDIEPYNTEMLIESYSYSDGEDVEAWLQSEGYRAVFDR
jgi:hypothetical protein